MLKRKTKTTLLEEFDSCGGEVGSGAFGSVVLRKLKGQVVAVKIFNINADDSCQKQILMKEAKVMGNLRQHICLPTMIGVSIDFSPYKLIMNFCSFEGGAENMYSLLKKKVHFPQMNEILFNIADALQTVHLSGYLHNDIKLDNIVIRGNKNNMIPVLIDFNKCTKKNERKTL